MISLKKLDTFGAVASGRMEIGNIATIADLRAINTGTTDPSLATQFPLLEDGSTARVLGAATQNDGGGGLFIFDADSVAADDGANTIAPTVGKGRWLRCVADNVISGDSGRKYRLVSGTIRNSGAGWALINDADHRPQGILSVAPDGDMIRLTYNFTAKKVGSLLVVPDETLAAKGIQCGASVGMTFSQIAIAAPFACNVDLDAGAIVDTPAYVANKLALVDNVFYQRLSHAANEAIPTCSMIGSSPLKYLPSLSFGAGVIDIYQFFAFSGYIYYDGAAWVLQKNNRSAVFSAVWDVDHLVVTHDVLQVANAVNLTPYPGIHAQLGSVGNNVFHVYFYDMAGAAIVAPSVAMKFWFQRPSLAQVNDLTGYVAINRGMLAINAADLVDAAGNLWIFGVFEV